MLTVSLIESRGLLASRHPPPEPAPARPGRLYRVLPRTSAAPFGAKGGLNSLQGSRIVLATSTSAEYRCNHSLNIKYVCLGRRLSRTAVVQLALMVWYWWAEDKIFRTFLRLVFFFEIAMTATGLVVLHLCPRQVEFSGTSRHLTWFITDSIYLC